MEFLASHLFAYCVAAVCYVEAGRRTWQNMSLYYLATGHGNEPLGRAICANRVPWPIVAMVYLGWPLVSGASTVTAWLARRQHARGLPSQFDAH